MKLRHVAWSTVVMAWVGCSNTEPQPQPTKGVAPAKPARPMEPGTEWTNDPAIEKRVSELLAKMTLDEKVGQLNQFSHGHATGPETGQKPYEEMIASGQLGSILNATGAKHTNELQHIAMEKSRLHIPILFGLDVIHGFRTTFPIPLALAATWDPELVQGAARIAAREASAEGVRWTFSPMVDIAHDARWGRIIEGAGEDPYLGSIMAKAYVRGYQGAHLTDPDSIAACAKHYVGYGAAEAGRDYNSTYIPERLLRAVYLPPFKAAVDAGVATLMSAFNAVNDVPASANAFTLSKVLKKEWRFKGFVVSDWTSVREIIAHGIATDDPTAARKGILAGVDMDMESSLYLPQLPNLVKAGKVPMSVIDDSVRRILRVKFALGLFDHPYTDEKPPATAPDPEGVKLAKQAALEAFVLLKNTAPMAPAPKGAKTATPATPAGTTAAAGAPPAGAAPADGAAPNTPAAAAPDAKTAAAGSAANATGTPVAGGTPILPIAPTVHRIALIGPLADSASDMQGGWAGAAHPEDVVTLRAALEAYAKEHKLQVTFERGTEVMAGDDSGIPKAVAAAKQAELVLLAVGENAGEMTGEASSRTRIDLPGRQSNLVSAIAATGKPTVLVVFSGRPLTLTPYIDGAAAVIQAWHPGIQAGPALVDVLFGIANFSGRLPVSFPRSLGQVPIYYNSLNTGRPADGIDLSKPPWATPADPAADAKYKSRYIDEQNAPLYTFGYGLSYTQFTYSPVTLSGTSLTAKSLDRGGAGITVRATVTNSGARDGIETAQLYVRLRGTSVALPVRELKGYQRFALKPGESREVQFTIGRDQLAFWNIDLKYGVEPATVSVWIAPDARSGTPAELTISP